MNILSYIFLYAIVGMETHENMDTFHPGLLTGHTAPIFLGDTFDGLRYLKSQGNDPLHCIVWQGLMPRIHGITLDNLTVVVFRYDCWDI